MSRRPSSSTSSMAPRSASSPYPRRTPGQPKSSRQQFSACGACRMRRVRCDLKDFYSANPTNDMQQPSCSNCKERNIKCVDEFAEVKAVKLLRRGRRLQQVEAVYGKVSNDASSPTASQSPTSTTFPVTTVPTGHGLIPQMQLDFLKSSFFRRFCVQYPVIEPGEFASRYVAHIEGTAPLHIEGRMLAMILVIWAASFGVDEFGNEGIKNDASKNHKNSQFIRDGGDNHLSPERSATIHRTEAMARELLALVDLHGLLRRPSWDGVKVLLLLLPLTHGVQSPIERLTTYEATLSQVHSLCNLENSPSVDSGLGPYCDVLVRTRIFWYAYVREGITTGLGGGRLVLDHDDLALFQSSLPSTSATHSIASPADSSSSSSASGSPITPTFPFNSSLEPSHPRAALAYQVASRYFSLTLAVSSVCRSIHSTLTGPRARRRVESGVIMCKESVVEIWNNLESCWDNFETLRRNPFGVGAAGGDLMRGEDVERFVSGWQVFIFQCLNVVREALPSPTSSRRAISTEQANLHLSATQRCQKYLPRVIKMLQRHLKVPSNFFAYDAGLIRDGCFFAGLLLAQSDVLDAQGMIGWDADWQEGVMACLQALGEIRWIYSCATERETALKAEWEARIERDISRRRVQQSPMSFPLKESPGHSPCLNDITPLPCLAASDSRPRALSLVSAGGQVRRPYLPPISVSFPQDERGPDTVLTDDGSGSWEAYTPPSTSGSMTGTVVTHRSLSPISPHHPTMISTVKTKDLIFGDDDDVDPFSFTVDGSPDSRTRARWTPFSGNYLDPRVVLGDNDFSPLGSTHRSYFS